MSTLLSKHGWNVLWLVVAIAAPFFVGPYGHYIMATILIYSLISLSLLVLLGIGGQISIGQAAFWAIGAYGSAILVTKLGLPFVVGIIGGGIIAGIFGLIVSLPALRVQGHYLAIATLGFSLVVHLGLMEFGWLTGGRQGLAVPRPSFLSYKLQEDFPYYYFILFVVLIAVWLTSNFRKSFVGRGLDSLRMSPIAAQLVGIGRAYHLIIAFVFSSVLCGVSGGLYAHLIGHLSTDSFTLMVSLSFLTMAIIGGMGSIAGAFVGAIFLAVLPEYLRGFTEAQNVFYGVILVMCMRFLPNGLSSAPGLIQKLFRRS